MKPNTSCIILAAAAVLVGCASQAPATSTATGAGQANAAAAPIATGTAQGNVATTSAGAGNGQTSVVTTAAVTSPEDKFVVPHGWRRVMVNGEERFCQKQVATGSRLEATETCLTKHQLEELQSGTQDFIQQIQRQGGQMAGQSGATTGGH